MAYNEEKIDKLLTEVKRRIRISSEKYKDAYVVNNMTGELKDEFYDIVGWMVMMSYRMIEASEKVIYDFDNIYWNKFLTNQTTEFLSKMKDMIENELFRRNIDDIDNTIK